MGTEEQNDKSGAVKGQDFAKPEADSKKPSHGEVANQKGGDFSELEETRMDHPPESRDTNGSENENTTHQESRPNQTNGVK